MAKARFYGFAVSWADAPFLWLTPFQVSGFKFQVLSGFAVSVETQNFASVHEESRPFLESHHGAILQFNGLMFKS